MVEQMLPPPPRTASRVHAEALLQRDAEMRAAIDGNRRHRTITRCVRSAVLGVIVCMPALVNESGAWALAGAAALALCCEVKRG